jgi:hypothetical protein
MDIFLLNKKDIDSKTILHKNLSNMHIALRNMHIAHIYIAANICTLPDIVQWALQKKRIWFKYQFLHSEYRM